MKRHSPTTRVCMCVCVCVGGELNLLSSVKCYFFIFSVSFTGYTSSVEAFNAISDGGIP